MITRYGKKRLSTPGNQLVSGVIKGAKQAMKMSTDVAALADNHMYRNIFNQCFLLA